MNDGEVSKWTGLVVPLAGVAALVVLGAVMFSAERASANPTISQKTGRACPACHTTPPNLNSAGKKYKETGK